MGYYVAMGRAPDAEPIEREEFLASIKASRWCLEFGEDERGSLRCLFTWRDNGAAPTGAAIGRMDIVDDPPGEGAFPFLVPWLSVRLSWATGSEFVPALRFLLGVAEQHGMVVRADGRVISREDVEAMAERFSRQSSMVLGWLGHVVPDADNSGRGG